jgi:hypothetical protein
LRAVSIYVAGSSSMSMPIRVDAGRHDFAGLQLGQADDAVHHRPFLLVEHTGFLAHADSGQELVLRQVAGPRGNMVAEPVGHLFEQQVRGVGRADDPGERLRVGARERHGEADGQALGRDFSEEEQQHGHDHDGEPFAVAGEEAFGDGVTHDRGHDVDHGVADQDGGKQPRGVVKDGGQAIGDPFAAGPDAVELEGADRKQGRFRTGEEGAQHEQGRQREEEGEQDGVHISASRLRRPRRDRRVTSAACGCRRRAFPPQARESSRDRPPSSGCARAGGAAARCLP